MKLKSKTYSIGYKELADKLLLKGSIVGVEKGEQCLYITTARDQELDVVDAEFNEWYKEQEGFLEQVDVTLADGWEIGIEFTPDDDL